MYLKKYSKTQRWNERSWKDYRGMWSFWRINKNLLNHIIAIFFYTFKKIKTQPMFVLRRVFNKEFYQKFKLGYIALEVLLIFIGITLASKYNTYKEAQKTDKFLIDNLKLYKENLESNLRINSHYLNGRKIELDSIIKFRDLLLTKNYSEQDILKHQQYIVLLFNTLTISNENTGFKNISNKDINIIKSEELKQRIIDYNISMDYNNADVALYNRNIERMPDYLFHHFKNINHDKRSIEEVISIENLKQDNRLINFLNQIIYERQIYLDLLERGFIVPTNNLVKEIDAEISRIE